MTTMDFGAAIFFTDYSIGPVELGRALEERTVVTLCRRRRRTKSCRCSIAAPR